MGKIGHASFAINRRPRVGLERPAAEKGSRSIPAKLVAPDAPRNTECFGAAFAGLTAGAHALMSWLLVLECACLVWAVLMPLAPSLAGSPAGLPMWAPALASCATVLAIIRFARLYPWSPVSRHGMAAAQILLSALLTRTAGGHIDERLQIFGSLAFLATYCDWRVLLTANALFYIPHLAGTHEGASLFASFNPLRRPEEALWLAGGNLILALAGLRIVRAMRAGAAREAQLGWDAGHDMLTGLPNRRALGQHFDVSMKKPAKRGAVLFIDLDRFKQANDTLGHTQGDRLLKMVAARLIEALPPGQTLARVGGDEFVVLLYDTAGPEDAISAAADLIAALRPLFRIDHHELVLSASIGISLCPEHGSDLAALQERADKAMFAAKSAGPGQFAIFSSEAADRESAMREIDRDLYLALPRGQLRVHYQPIVEHTGRLLGFEALVRWQHPTRGLVMPGDFISSAEKSGLIAGIGEWVLGEACRDCKTWQLPNGAPIGVAVNVSPVQFEQDDFPAQVMSILRQCEMVPSLVTLELTEGLLIREIDRTSAQLTGLRAAGVQVAIDDFGTGYSSLSYLTSLPVDAVKLDRSFINRSPATALSVVSSVVDMAHRIGLRVVAEGVETMIQARQIIGANCDEIQGLCFSGPIPADSVASFLRTNVTESGYVRSAAFPRTGRMSYKEVIRFQESAAS